MIHETFGLLLLFLLKLNELIKIEIENVFQIFSFIMNILFLHIYELSIHELANKVKKEIINSRIGVLNGTLNKHKHEDSLNAPDTEKALESVHNRFVTVPII